MTHCDLYASEHTKVKRFHYYSSHEVMPGSLQLMVPLLATKLFTKKKSGRKHYITVHAPVSPVFFNWNYIAYNSYCAWSNVVLSINNLLQWLLWKIQPGSIQYCSFGGLFRKSELSRALENQMLQILNVLFNRRAHVPQKYGLLRTFDCRPGLYKRARALTPNVKNQTRSHPQWMRSSQVARASDCHGNFSCILPS